MDGGGLPQPASPPLPAPQVGGEAPPPPPMTAGYAAPPPPQPYRRPKGERWKLVLGLISVFGGSLIGLLLLGYLAPFIAVVYNALGLIGLLLFIAGLVGLFIAFLVFLILGRRPEPHYEAPATIDSLQTKQS